ncbi:reverse transcriptase, partial [Reticulomyxa filosa]
YIAVTGEDQFPFNTNAFHLCYFQKEVLAARQISEHIIIGGDWNAHHPAWLDKNIDEMGEAILEFITSNDLHILNSFPFDCTYQNNNASSCIDITLCSSSLVGLCSNWRTDDDELDVHSGHLPITFNILAQWAPQNIKRQNIVTWNLSSDQWEMFRHYLAANLKVWSDSIPNSLQGSSDALDQAVEAWTHCVVETGKATIGQKTIWKGNKPWWSNKLHKMRKKVHQLKRNFRKNRTSENYEIYKEAARTLKRNLRCEKQLHITKSIESLHEGNTRQLFCKFRSLNSNKIAIIPSLVSPGKDGTTHQIAENDIDKANLLARWFAQPPQPPKPSNEDAEHYEYVKDEICSVVQMSRESELDTSWLILEWHQADITEEEIIEAIGQVSSFKSQDPDNIHNLMLKKGGQSLIDSLVMLSLLSCVGKLLERIVTMRLMRYLNERQMLHQSQAGFQSWHNTSELILKLSESIHKSFNKKGLTYATMLDISEAYGSVWRD